MLFLGRLRGRKYKEKEGRAIRVGR